MVRVYAKEPVNYFQDGGMQAPQQQMDQEQLMQIIQMFAQVTGNDPEQVMAQFQELDPETQMQAVEQMIQMIQSEQAAQAPEPMPGEGMQQGMPASEAEAQMMGAPGEGEMAEQMMRMGGMYAKSQKKLLKKAVGGSLGKKGDTSKSMQEKLGEAVRSAIGLNFTENLIENSAKGFNDRNMNQFANGGNAPDNTYFSSANQMAKDAYRDQMSAGALFDERLENMGSSINPYLKIKGKAIGDEYNMFNRPKFTQNVFGADIESSGYGALFPENIPSQYMGGQPDIPLFQNAGQTNTDAAYEKYKNDLSLLNQNKEKGLLSDTEYKEAITRLDNEYQGTGGKAVYDEKPKGTGYDYNLRWKGNLDKATENLYLKGADLKTGFLNRNNIRKASFTFGERGTGMGAPGDVAQINGQTDSRINQQGALNVPGDATSQGISDQQIQRMDERAGRRMQRDRNRYARMFGEDAANRMYANDDMMQPAADMSAYAGMLDPMYNRQQNAFQTAANTGAQSIMNIGTQGTTGDYMDQFGQNPMGYRSGGLTRAQDGIPRAPAPASSTNVVMPRTGPSSMQEVMQMNDEYLNALALANDPTAVVGFANPNPGFAQDSIFFYPGQNRGSFMPYQIGRDRNDLVLYGVSDNPPSLRDMAKYGNITTGEAGVGQSGNRFIDIAGPRTESRRLPMYTYSGRPNVLYMKSPQGKWLINTDGDPDGEFIPIKDPEGKRKEELDKKARKTYDFESPSLRFGGMTNFGYGLPLAVDGMNNFNSEEDKFKITMKEKSGIGSAAAPLVMAKIQEGLGSINTARALQQQNLAYNPALNNPVVPGDMLGSLGSFTSTTGPSVFMPNQMQGMMQGRFGAAQPAQMQGMYYTQLGGQPDLSGYGVGDDAYLTDQEIEAFMRMGGKVEYY